MGGRKWEVGKAEDLHRHTINLQGNLPAIHMADQVFVKFGGIQV
jgi:hypothetical protein